MKKSLAICCITVLFSLGGCQLVGADGECVGICPPICNDISGSTCTMG